MKKLTYLFLALLIAACSTDNSDGDSGDNNDGGDNGGNDNNTNCEYVLNTLSVTNTINDTATFNGVISIDGNCEFPITEQGFVYATTIQPTLNNNQVNVNGNNVTTTINNLEPNTTYYVRTFLTNVLGEFYGNEINFLSNNSVYLDENGITVKAYEWSEVGDTGVIDGVTYTVVDLSTLNTMINNGDDVTKVCTSLVTNMSDMFSGSSFNQPIGNWDVSNVTDMSAMFAYATAFNQPIDNWDVSNVTNMSYMFSQATAFNQPIGNWDVSNVTDMNYMFYRAEAFNQPIGNWDVSNVTTMYSMFSNLEGYSTAFNQPLGNWDVSSVTDMGYMFAWAYSYNQNLSSWDVNNVTYCYRFSHFIVGWTEPKPNFTIICNP